MSSPVPGPSGSVTVTVWSTLSSRLTGVTFAVPTPLSHVNVGTVGLLAPIGWSVELSVAVVPAYQPRARFAESNARAVTANGVPAACGELIVSIVKWSSGPVAAIGADVPKIVPSPVSVAVTVQSPGAQ